MAKSAARTRLAIEGPVAIITLIRSDQLNAFDAAMHEAMTNDLDTIATRPEVRALILHGEGRAFSAGQDLRERAEVFAAGHMPDLYGALDTLYNPLIRRITGLPIPVIAAVGGIAFGAGAALAVACDITLAAASARFQFGFVNVGLGPDSAASWTLPRLVGAQRAMDLLLSGRPVSGEEAERIGLVARCVDDANLLDESRKLAHQFAQKSPEAVSAIKRQLRTSANLTLDQALDTERDCQAALGRTDAYRDAVLSFAQRDSGTAPV